MISLEVLPRSTGYRSEPESFGITQPLVFDIRMDSAVVIETTGDWRLVLTAYAAYALPVDRKSTRLNSSHGYISYAVFCLKKKKKIPHALLSRTAASVTEAY